MNSAMIDVTLGMALLYAVLSLFVTTIQEYLVNSVMHWRSRHMVKTVSSAFGDDKALTQAFFDHPMIISLTDGKGWRPPSYIPDEVFAKVFLAVLNHGHHPSDSNLQPASFMARLSGDLAATSTKGKSDYVASMRLATNGATDWPSFESGIVRWLADIGERSQGWFKRSAQRWTFVIATVVAVGLNVDSVMIARTLWSDAELRTQLADTAVAVDGALRAQPSASQPAIPLITPVANRFEVRLDLVEKGLETVKAQLKDSAFLQEDSFYAVKCELRVARCGNDVLLGQRCRVGLEIPLAKAEDCPEEVKPPASQNRKGPAREIAPATHWLDDIENLLTQLRQARAVAIRGGEKLKFTADLRAQVNLTERTLGAIVGEMQLVLFKQPDTKGKAGRLMDALLRSTAEVQREVTRLYNEPGLDTERARAECQLQFKSATPSLADCVRRREGAQPFQLPMGFQPAVLARQLSDEKLDSCSKAEQGCGTLNLLLNAAGNGAWLGWLLSAIALSLGAPFWFDTLGRLVKMRASGTKPANPEDDAAKKKAADTAPSSSATKPAAPAETRSAGGTTDRASPIENTLSDAETRSLQQRLGVSTTGVFDSPTREAIAQRRAQLGLDGGAVLDEALYEAIMERRTPTVESRPSLQMGQTHELVPELRRRLVQLLALPTRAAGSGDSFDTELRAAVRLFQGRVGLTPDGVVGSQTWRILDAGGGRASDADAWMKPAVSALGLDEVNDEDEVRKFLAALKLGDRKPADTAWCACFVAWALQPAAPPTETPEGAKNWIGWGTPTEEDRYGAVVVLRSLKTRGDPQHHVAFLVGKTSQGWVILGGNQGDKGKVSVEQFGDEGWEVVYRGMPEA